MLGPTLPSMKKQSELTCQGNNDQKTMKLYLQGKKKNYHCGIFTQEKYVYRMRKKITIFSDKQK
jgi:hypothetical protein